MANTSKIESHRIKYGEEIIQYKLEYRDRKTMEINVYPDTSVKVIAPIGRNFAEIEAKVRKRALWIIEQRHFFSLWLPEAPGKRYVSGESFYYLGKQYRLKVVGSSSQAVTLKRGIIYVNCYDRHNSEMIKKMLENWYRRRAEIKFKERLDFCYDLIQKYGVSEPFLQIRKMKRRWGSCSQNNTIILNTELIKAPSYCIDYVIMHEMCHLKYFNHGKAFYNLLTRLLPDWEKRKNRLEKVVL